MKPQLVIVKTPNKMLFIKGKLSRTPLEAIIKSPQELNLLKSSMIHQGVEFIVEDYKPVRVKKKEIVKQIKTKKPTPKKKITNPKTILEKIEVEEDGE